MKVFYVTRYLGPSCWGEPTYKRVSPYFKYERSALNFAKEKGYEITKDWFSPYYIDEEELEILD